MEITEDEWNRIVDINNPVPLIFRDLHDRGGRVDSGSIDQCVHPAPLVHALSDRLLQRALVPDISLADHRITTICFNQFSTLICSLLAATIENGCLRPGSGERLGHLAAKHTTPSNGGRDAVLKREE